MRATLHKPLFDLAQRTPATRNAPSSRQAARVPDPTRPAPARPRPLGRLLHSFALRRSDHPIPADPRLLHPRPPLPSPPQSSQPPTPRRIDQDQRAGPRDTDLGRGHGGSQSIPSGLFRRMPAGWSPLAVQAAFPEAAHTDETKRNNLQTLRIHALSRKNMARQPLESRVRPPLATIGGAKTRCDKE